MTTRPRRTYLVLWLRRVRLCVRRVRLCVCRVRPRQVQVLSVLWLQRVQLCRVSVLHVHLSVLRRAPHRLW
ncbi:hypothetical protein PF008_g22470 [Phytophthora fragariae]|uniref:Uncharacterized protein n=1 Tax=Phytophthora fragariae TaxID=53985 RepID=A0A6G0QTM1_9STRA|nr:hypothetical protein PF008_g22470 [Phytophthora fragariae]